MSKIYTRSGDTGDTGLFGGQRVHKDDLRVEAYGAVDELNAVLGLARTQPLEADMDDLLQIVQNDLFNLGSDLATPEEKDTRKGRIHITRVAPAQVTFLEGQMTISRRNYRRLRTSFCRAAALAPPLCTMPASYAVGPSGASLL